MDPMNPQGAAPAPATTKIGGLGTNIAAALCYLPICGISLFGSALFLFTEPPESKLVRFHAIQSLLAFAAICAINVPLSCLSGVVGSVLDGGAGAIIGLVFSAISGLASLAFLIVLCIGMFKGYKGEIFKLPLIGNFAAKKAGVE